MPVDQLSAVRYQLSVCSSMKPHQPTFGKEGEPRGDFSRELFSEELGLKLIAEC